MNERTEKKKGREKERKGENRVEKECEYLYFVELCNIGPMTAKKVCKKRGKNMYLALFPGIIFFKESFLMLPMGVRIESTDPNLDTCTQGWGAGARASWKKKSGAGAAKKLAGSSALREDKKHKEIVL